MSVDWLTWSNPVAIWWEFLLFVSALNIALLFNLRAWSRARSSHGRTGAFGIEPPVLLSVVYVLVCAFRCVLPRADVQRICLFDTWLSSVFVGRSVATVAEICFVIQWAIVLREMGKLVESDTANNIAKAIVPLIALAATYLLVAIALLRMLPRFRGLVQFALVGAVAGVAGYLVFMATIDVPMYFSRWQTQLARRKRVFRAVRRLT